MRKSPRRRRPPAGLRRSGRRSAGGSLLAPRVLRAALAALAAALCAAGCGRTEAAIWYSASVNGNLDGCACVSHPRAGLVKSAAYLRAAPDRERVLLVDAGDLSDGRDGRLAEELLAVYDELEYDAVAVGDQEVALGASLLRELADRHPCLLAHNLSLRPDLDPPPPLSEAPLVVELSWGRATVVALLDPATLARYPPEVLEGVRIASPEAAARVLLGRQPAGAAPLRVLLFHGSWEAAERLAAAVPGFDVIVVGHDGGLHEPRRIRGAVLVSPGEEGNRIGRLALTVAGPSGRPRMVRSANSFRLFSTASDPDDPRVRSRIEAFRDALRVPTEAGASVP